MPVVQFPDSPTVVTTRVLHRFRDLAGNPVPRASVQARLQAPHGWLLDRSEVADFSTTATTDDDGAYEFRLVPSQFYEFPYAYYQVTEGSKLWTISVPAPDHLDSPVQLRDCLIDPPVITGLPVLVAPSIVVIGPADTTDGIPPGTVVYQLTDPL